MEKNNYNPDILTCLGNLSNDEVFTLPVLANKMIDLLPKEIFTNKNITFFDPCSKSGVFLREIAKRLNEGLKNEILDDDERWNHIFKNQLFGLSITELTGLISRRSLYCAKNAASYLSVANFDNYEGNILFKEGAHKWENKKCIYCGCPYDIFERDKSNENHAYWFIHDEKVREFFEMKFDVVIGNPPYQIEDGGAQASASPIYDKFVEQAMRLNPKYLCMIIPSRWFAGGKGLDNFRDDMINDTRVKEIHDFPNAKVCFPSVEIKGGVCYFLWDRDYNGKAKFVNYDLEGKKIDETNRYLKYSSSGEEVVIRYNKAIKILDKIWTNNVQIRSFSDFVSSSKPFGLRGFFSDYSTKKNNDRNILIYMNKRQGYVSLDQLLKNDDWVNKWKVFVPKAIGSANIKNDRVKPILGEPWTACTETYLVIGPFENKKTCDNVISYINTKFFHFLLGMKKVTQDTTKKVYDLIPLVDLNQEWSDEKLYQLFNLSEEEIEYIENTVWPNK